MRRYLIFLLLPVCLLWGCQKQTNEMGTKTYSISEAEQGNQSVLYYSGQETIAEEGVLFPVELQEGGILTYYDYAQEEMYPFCSNVNCEHNDSSCSAWFDSFAEAPGIYNGQVYVFSYINEKDEWDLVSMEVDGTNRKTVAQFTAEDFGCDSLISGVPNCWYIDGKAVFIMTCGFWEEEGADFRAIVQVNLSDGRKEILAEIGNEDNVIGIYNDVLLILGKEPITPLLEKDEFFKENGKQADYDEYYSEWYNNSYREIYYSLNTSTGEKKEFFEAVGNTPEWDYSHISSDGIFYYSTDKAIGSVNLLTDEVDTAYESEHNVTIECSADGKVFFLTLTDERNKKINDCYLDLKTGEVTALSENMPDGSWIYGETSQYFVGNGPINFIFIPKEDYYSGNYGAAKDIKALE